MPIHRSATLFATVLALGALGPSPSLAAQEATPAPQQPIEVEVEVPDAEPKRQVVEVERVGLPGAAGAEDYPYTVQVPADWSVHRPIGAPGAFLGPPDADPAATPEMLLVQESDVDLSDPSAVLENLRSNAQRGSWTLEEGEVRDFGGIEGLWIVQKLPPDPEGRFPERFHVAVKLPLEEGSLNVAATVPASLYGGSREVLIKYMLGSIQRSGDPAE